MDNVDQGLPLEPGRGRSRQTRAGGFKTVELNALGWSALVGAGTAAGAAASLATRIPLLGSIALGVLGTWIITIGIDHRRWRNATTHISRGDMSEHGYRRALEALQSRGIDATYREIVDEDSGDIQRGIECRQADAETVSAVLQDLKL